MADIANDSVTPAIEFPDTPEVNQWITTVAQLEQLLAMAKCNLEFAVKEAQEGCGRRGHDFEPVMVFDKEYCGRLDRIGKGQDIFIGRKCKKCKKYEPRSDGFPWQICYKCGGIMKHDHNELFGEDRVHINKCQSCGHEHDTT